MKLHYFVGNDLGNSEQDIVINGKLIQQPNVFAAGGLIPWVDDETDVPKNLKNIYGNIAVSIVSTAGIQTGLYHIGAYALKTHGEDVTSLYVKGNNSKSDQLVPYVNTLGTIAARAVEEVFEMTNEVPDQITVSVDMAAALPVKQHTPNNIKTMQNRFMSSPHVITVHLGLTKKVSVTIKFEYVHILQEGSAVVFALQLDSESQWRTGEYFKSAAKKEDKKKIEDVGLFTEFSKTYGLGEIDGSYFEGKNLLHFDAGDGTTDSPYTKGDLVDKDYCDGINNGVGHAIERAQRDFLALVPFAFNSISRQQFSEILKSQFADRKDKFLNEALQAFNPHFENQVKQMMKLGNDQILRIGSNEIDILVVYGGGSILSRPLLYDKLKALADSVRIQLFYVPAKYAVTLNAEGLDYFVKSDIYKFHKKNYIATFNKKIDSKDVAATAEIEENNK
ncbi:ParM/StbA family protein (plasmid) [Paenibacillus sonchi]|uniref:ParM/StbA family protein n=1 Tax=Paenibacillus sonchi TaxID=373687 RepID=A0A974SGQ4_9BACL|nr:ParM/StbA family protein [Paenibacillus sonchi]QQZ64631.1 ParM/StbA family protein [Paenibacillus sonchi]